MPFRIACSCFSVAAFASLALSYAPLNAQTPPEYLERQSVTKLAPVTPWNIDFGENKCRLTRLFGNTEKPHLIAFEQAAPRNSFGMTLAGPELDRFRTAGRVQIGLERDEDMRSFKELSRGSVEGVGTALIMSSLSIGKFDEDKVSDGNGLQTAGIDLDEAETVDSVVIGRGKIALEFESGNLMPAFQALNTCTQDLLRVWGLEPEEHKNFVPPKWLNEMKIAKRIQAKYPPSALRIGEQAIFRLRVIVEKDGTVSDCHMEKSTMTERLESPACKSMMDARFEPALDASGQPMRSFYATTVQYRIG